MIGMFGMEIFKMTTGDLLLTGQTESHTHLFQASFRVHQELIKPLRALEAEARNAGFQFQVVSAFRSFQKQVDIWNAKTEGKLPVLDEQGVPLSTEKLSSHELMEAILKWSALPGTSRHHWGTDLDVIDGAGLREGDRVRLVPEEFSGNGPFAALHLWLDQHLSRFGFFRPYRMDRGGVRPERWHISYAPLAEKFLEQLTEEKVAQALESSNLILKKEALQNLKSIFQTYVKNIDPV
ncbi:D-alanyl-D-alanine carboxypeptidase family protein [bacterium]|nr:D-alanyl-D-alanine carboxypeptidase family protein [bacterium]